MNVPKRPERYRIATSLPRCCRPTVMTQKERCTVLTQKGRCTVLTFFFLIRNETTASLHFQAAFQMFTVKRLSYKWMNKPVRAQYTFLIRGCACFILKAKTCTSEHFLGHEDHPTTESEREVNSRDLINNSRDFIRSLHFNRLSKLEKFSKLLRLAPVENTSDAPKTNKWLTPWNLRVTHQILSILPISEL